MISIRPLLKLLTIIIILIIVLSSNCYPDVHFVSKTGTSQFPYTSWVTASDSIQKCINVCNSGDTVYIANGTYKETLVIAIPISLFGSSMDSTVVDGTGLAKTTVNITADIHIENINFIGRGVEPLTNVLFSTKNLAYIRIRNCRVSNALEAIGISWGNAFLENIISKDGSNNIYISKNVVNYVDTIQNCVIIMNGTSTGDALYLEGNSFISNNILVALNSNSLYGIYCDYTDSLTINNNIILGFSIGLTFSQIPDTAIMENNLINYSIDYGIGSYGKGSKFRNNIFTGNMNPIYLSGDTTKNRTDYNLFWKNKISIPLGQVMGEHDITADPMFVNDDAIITYPLKSDYHLQAFSPAINQGDPSILNKDLSRSDIGAYGGPNGETYKYDDLAPKPPRNLTAVVDSFMITLTWDKNTEADTAYYNLYRDTIPGFTIDPSKLISRQKGNVFILPLPHNIKNLYYKLTAEDKTGHVSAPSEELTITLSSTDKTYTVISDYKLFQNYPNPFNPLTIISYRLKERGYVKLMVYDLTGKLIKVLVNETKEQGYYEKEFNAKGLASGIYLYRIEVIGENRIPKFNDMKKLIYLK
ncbi:MAG: NosD domain-containing protein [Ignavibacteriaceae bacterium]|nr:NosD domain-containing protein [Ignavibacteriaceae bacterium]